MKIAWIGALILHFVLFIIVFPTALLAVAIVTVAGVWIVVELIAHSVILDPARDDDAAIPDRSRRAVHAASAARSHGPTWPICCVPTRCSGTASQLVTT